MAHYMTDLAVSHFIISSQLCRGRSWVFTRFYSDREGRKVVVGMVLTFMLGQLLFLELDIYAGRAGSTTSRHACPGPVDVEKG